MALSTKSIKKESFKEVEAKEIVAEKKEPKYVVALDAEGKGYLKKVE